MRIMEPVLPREMETAIPLEEALAMAAAYEEPVYGYAFAGGSAAGSAFCIVAFDPHGAAAGDTVAYVDGAEASAPFYSPAPVDAYCAGIVEKINIYNDK